MTEDIKQETGDRRRETGDVRQDTGDRRRDRKKGDGRWFSDDIFGKFIAFNLAGEFYHFLRKLIDNEKYELAVGAKSAKCFFK